MADDEIRAINRRLEKRLASSTLEPIACPIDGWADHPWRVFTAPTATVEICAEYLCYYLEERHHA